MSETPKLKLESKLVSFRKDRRAERKEVQFDAARRYKKKSSGSQSILDRFCALLIGARTGNEFLRNADKALSLSLSHVAEERATGKRPIGNAQPVGGQSKKKEEKQRAKDLFRAYPRGRYRPSIFRLRAYRALISLAARTRRFCAKARVHSTACNLRPDDRRAFCRTLNLALQPERRIRTRRLSSVSMTDTLFYCARHAEEIRDTDAALHFLLYSFFR